MRCLAGQPFFCGSTALRSRALRPQLKRDSLDGRTMRSVGFLMLFALSLACGEVRDIISLQQSVAREFHNSGVNINLNNAVHLTVTFADSSTAALPDSDRVAFAVRVAEYVRDHYARYDTLQTISIGFATVKQTGPITFTNSRVLYRFNPRELGSPRSSSTAPHQ